MEITQLHRDMGELQGTVKAMSNELTEMRDDIKELMELKQLVISNGKQAEVAMVKVQDLTDMMNQVKGMRYFIVGALGIMSTLIAVAGYLGIKLTTASS